MTSTAILDPSSSSTFGKAKLAGGGGRRTGHKEGGDSTAKNCQCRRYVKKKNIQEDGEEEENPCIGPRGRSIASMGPDGNQRTSEFGQASIGQGSSLGRGKTHPRKSTEEEEEKTKKTLKKWITRRYY